MGTLLISISMILAVATALHPTPQFSALAVRNLLASAQLSSATSAKSNDEKGTANASAVLTVTEGAGSVSSTASAEAYEEATSKIAERVRELLVDFPERDGKSDDAYCRDLSSSIEIGARSAAEVAVKANVETLSSVEIDGAGKGCASSVATARAQVTAFAQTIVRAWAEAKGHNAVSSASTTIDATVTALAEAVADASADACTQSDGTKPFFSEAYQSVLAEAYTKAFVSIMALLEAYIDCSGGTGASASADIQPKTINDETILTSTSNTQATGKGSATTSATGIAQADQVHPCSKIPNLSTCCRGRNLLDITTQCFCNLTGWEPSDPVCQARKITSDGKTFWDYSISGQEGLCSC